MKNPVSKLRAAAALLAFLGVIMQAQAAYALLPPHGPTYAVPDIGDNGSAIRTGDASKAALFLLRSNPLARIEAQVAISTLNDKISHLQDPSFIMPDVDSKKYSPELIERAINLIRTHYLAALLTERGTLLAVLGETDRAIADLGAALDSDSKNFQAYNNRACLKASEGDFDGALADANKALTLSPNFAEAYDTRGTVYLAQGQFQKAADDLNRAITEKPKYAEAFFHRSLALKALGKVTEADADMKHAKELGYHE